VKDYFVYAIAAGVVLYPTVASWGRAAWAYITRPRPETPRRRATDSIRWKAPWLDRLMQLEAVLAAEGNTQAVETCRTLCVQIVNSKQP